MTSTHFTFGICTDGTQNERIHKIIDSIEQECPIHNYEIIITAPIDISIPRINTTTLKIEDLGRQMWITKHKNEQARLAKYPNLVLMHDYIKLLPGWYRGYCNFENCWQVAMNPILNLDGTRFRDWMIWDGDYHNGKIRFLDYDVDDQIHNMYISGSYFVVKTDYFRENPLDENRVWGQGEDVEWSLRLRDCWYYKLNRLSLVQFLKQKHCYPASPGIIKHNEYIKTK